MVASRRENVPVIVGDGEIVSEIVPEVMGFVPEVEGDAEAVHEVVGVRPGRAGRLG